MFRNMVTDFLDKEHLVTTVPKAKELRPVAEKMITLGKQETLHARRRALSFIRTKAVVRKLFDDLAPRFADRHGGYTRIVRVGFRRGDNAELALLEMVGSEFQTSTDTSKKEKKEKKEAKAEKEEKESKEEKE
jgi:large subunit ribosomal protein L17